jgi:serine/threonine-protein kinase
MANGNEPARERWSSGPSSSGDELLSTVDARGDTPERLSLPEPPPPRPGDQVGRFHLLAELGRGGMGVVYAAEDRTLGREVALKVMPLAGDEERKKRFLREARAVAALNDATIATLYEVGEDGGRVFIAMELVRGKTLRALLDERPTSDRALPLDEARRIARAIAQALAVAHERGVVHRDLKPENVMIADDGAIKLLDFGIAKRVEATSPITVAETATTAEGRILGTPMYMSPEQAKGRPVDARSDVFSFGVMLYELCTGARPFAGATVVELFIALDRDEAAPPSRVNPRVPAGLERVVMRCLQKQPADRYASARELLADLDAPSLEPAPARAGASRARAWITVAVAAVLIAALAYFQRSHAIPGVAPAPTPLTSVAPPTGAAPAALAAYREGLAQFRAGGAWSAPITRAAELDPSFGAPHVMLAAQAMLSCDENTRLAYRTAETLSASLGARDRALLAAIEPVVLRQPSDWAESKRRIEALIARTPGDAHLWWLLAAGSSNFDDFEAAVRQLERAVALDPQFAMAHGRMGMMLAYLGRFQEARAAIDRCLALNAAAESCLSTLGLLQEEAGECEGLEATSRRLIAASALPVIGYPLLAQALAARGRPPATVREALRQAEEGVSALPAPTQKGARAGLTTTALAAMVLEGDFDKALEGARALAPSVASSKRQADHGALAAGIAALLQEMGRKEEAAQVALDFLDRRDAWEPDPGAEDIALARDPTPQLLRIALHGGRLTASEVAARRDAWARAWDARVTPVSRPYLWMYAHAAVADTAEDARAALAAQPAYGALPSFRPSTLVDADVGRTYLLAGRYADAVSWLDHATRTCSALRFPFQHMRARLLLGRAHEARGDKRSACAAYREVLDRWGAAKPRSVTADEARDRARVLGCDP